MNIPLSLRTLIANRWWSPMPTSASKESRRARYRPLTILEAFLAKLAVFKVTSNFCDFSWSVSPLFTSIWYCGRLMIPRFCKCDASCSAFASVCISAATSRITFCARSWGISPIGGRDKVSVTVLYFSPTASTEYRFGNKIWTRWG